jgi:hypothetical protein
MLLHALVLIGALEDRASTHVSKAILTITQTSSSRDAGGAVTNTFTVENTGAQNGAQATAVIRNVAITGDRTQIFHVVNDGCSGSSLENGESCTVSVVFHPRSAREPQTAALVVYPYDDGIDSDGVFVAVSDAP